MKVIHNGNSVIVYQYGSHYILSLVASTEHDTALFEITDMATGSVSAEYLLRVTPATAGGFVCDILAGEDLIGSVDLDYNPLEKTPAAGDSRQHTGIPRTVPASSGIDVHLTYYEKCATANTMGLQYFQSRAGLTYPGYVFSRVDPGHLTEKEQMDIEQTGIYTVAPLEYNANMVIMSTGLQRSSAGNLLVNFTMYFNEPGYIATSIDHTFEYTGMADQFSWGIRPVHVKGDRDYTVVIEWVYDKASDSSIVETCALHNNASVFDVSAGTYFKAGTYNMQPLVFKNFTSSDQNLNSMNLADLYQCTTFRNNGPLVVFGRLWISTPGNVNDMADLTQQDP